jgi:5-methylcytosine-specific restriction endonuclease McrA
MSARRGSADYDRYRELCQEALRRDSWRCQFCGSSKNLQIHHMVLRSHQGADTLDNLITLCATCHRMVHTGTHADK